MTMIYTKKYGKPSYEVGKYTTGQPYEIVPLENDSNISNQEWIDLLEKERKSCNEILAKPQYKTISSDPEFTMWIPDYDVEVDPKEEITFKGCNTIYQKLMKKRIDREKNLCSSCIFNEFLQWKWASSTYNRHCIYTIMILKNLWDPCQVTYDKFVDCIDDVIEYIKEFRFYYDEE